MATRPELRRRLLWLDVGSSALLEVTIGYLLVVDARAPLQLGLFTVAMALRALITDRGLYETHRHDFDRYGRPVLLAAPPSAGSSASPATCPHPPSERSAPLRELEGDPMTLLAPSPSAHLVRQGPVGRAWAPGSVVTAGLMCWWPTAIGDDRRSSRRDRTLGS